MNSPEEKHTLGTQPISDDFDECPFLWGPRYTRLRNKALIASGAVFATSGILGTAVAPALASEGGELGVFEYSDEVLLVGGMVGVLALLAVAGFAEHRRRRAHRAWIYN